MSRQTRFRSVAILIGCKPHLVQDRVRVITVIIAEESLEVPSDRDPR